MRSLKLIFIVLGLIISYKFIPHDFENPVYYKLYPLVDIENSARGYVATIIKWLILFIFTVALYLKESHKYKPYLFICCVMFFGIVIENIISFNEPWFLLPYGDESVGFSLTHFFTLFVGLMLAHVRYWNNRNWNNRNN